jgi:hypothetical protein
VQVINSYFFLLQIISSSEVSIRMLAHSTVFGLLGGVLLAITGPSFILVRGISGEDFHVCVREGEQPVDSLKIQILS